MPGRKSRMGLTRTPRERWAFRRRLEQCPHNLGAGVVRSHRAGLPTGAGALNGRFEPGCESGSRVCQLCIAAGAALVLRLWSRGAAARCHPLPLAADLPAGAAGGSVPGICLAQGYLSLAVRGHDVRPPSGAGGVSGTLSSSTEAVPAGCPGSGSSGRHVHAASAGERVAVPCRGS